MNGYHLAAAIFWLESVYYNHKEEKGADRMATFFAILFFVIAELK